MRVLTVVFALIAGQATALSCVPNDVQLMYKFAAQAEERYLPVVGEFTFAPRTDSGAKDDAETDSMANLHNPKGRGFPAQFEGKALNRHGFSTPYKTEVTVEVNCLASWCGDITSGQTYLALLQLEDDKTHWLTVGPCRQRMLSDPSKTQIGDFVRCHKGEACKSQYE